MRLYPAIDIRNGKVVRLEQGDYDKMTIYADSPADMAERFAQSGAQNIHVVDLDGAKDGALSNFNVIADILGRSGLFVEVGGGIRDEERIAKYLEAGAGRVILGTVAIKNPEFVSEMVKKFKGKIAVGIDAKDGFVAINGWKEVTDTNSIDFCRKMRDFGVETVIYTDISKDGLLSGTNLDIYRKLGDIKGLNVIASGGITYYSELSALKDMSVYGAILGKALYAGKIDLKRAVELCGEDGIC